MKAVWNMKKVLIIDDQLSIRKLIDEVLNDEYEIKSTGTAEDAIKICAQYIPDVILLDLGLPEKDGIDILPSLKNMLPECRIIILSGVANSYVLKKAFSLGASGYIGKPFDIFKMKAMLNRILAN